jgi:hypothetical protein
MQTKSRILTAFGSIGFGVLCGVKVFFDGGRFDAARGTGAAGIRGDAKAKKKKIIVVGGGICGVTTA